jgi:hypothetical protein
MYLQRLLLAIFVGGVVGTCAELALLEHYEDVKQLIPLFLGAAGLVVALWYWRRPGPVSTSGFMTIQVAFAVSGLLGLWFHYRGNVEFEKEIYPELAGKALVWQSLTGATPTLAPGAMVFLALVGYAAVAAASRDRA